MRTQAQNLEALSLDSFVLDSLLKQHRCSHGRAKYFQRVSMTLRALRRYQIMDFPARIDELQKKINSISQERKRKRRRRHEKNADDEWYQNKDDDKKKTQEEEQLKVLEGLFVKVESTLLTYIPEIMSRIEHASSALLVEVSRAFFLPFCTVALGALARIRVLLLGIGCRALTDLHQLRGNLHEIGVGTSSSSSSLPFLSFFLSINELEHAMVYFEEEPLTNHASSKSKKLAKLEHDKALESLGLTCPSATGRQPSTEKSTRAWTDSKTAEDTDDNLEMAMELPADKGELHPDRNQDDDDDDLGEAVGRDISLEEQETNPDDANDFLSSTLPPTTSSATKDDQCTSDPLDRNMAFVQAHKAKKKGAKGSSSSSRDKKEKASKKRDNSQQDESSSPTTPQKRDKKKKKKKSSKQDFFDKLFD